MYEGNEPARGARIASLRAGRLMTQAGLATAAGLHVATVRRAEAGRPLSAETAQAICAVLELAPGGLAPPDGDVTVSDVVGAMNTTASLAFDVPPRARRPGLVRWLGTAVLATCALGVVGFEWASWASAEPSWFLILQAGAQTCVALAFCVLATRALARRRTAVRAALLAIAVAATAWPGTQVWASLSDTARDIAGNMIGYSHARAVVRMRAALDPAWDRTEADWELVRILSGQVGHTSDYLGTPGAFSWHLKRIQECHNFYLHAEVYPWDVCSPPMKPIPFPLHRLLWQSLVGGSFMPAEFRGRTFDEVVNGDGFAEARALMARVRRFDDPSDAAGKMTEAEAFAEAARIAATRRDLPGSGR